MIRTIVEDAPISAIVAHTEIWGPDTILLRVELVECARLTELKHVIAGNSIYLTAKQRRMEPCGSLYDGPIPPGGLLGPHIVILDHVTLQQSPGTYQIVYTNPEGQEVQIPIQVLPATTITNLVFDPPPPATIEYGELINFTFDFDTPATGLFGASVRESAGLSCGCTMSGPGTGSANGCFALQYGPEGQALHSIRLSISACSDGRVTFEGDFPVQYTFTHFSASAPAVSAGR